MEKIQEQEGLLENKASKLLDKFGVGEHKPGSGSAAAFQGMLSAQLIKTVISITTGEKYKNIYQGVVSEFLKMKAEIEKEIYPELGRLLDADSIQFDKVIQLRNARKNEKDPIKKSQLLTQELEELKLATEIPIEISKLCIRLAEFAIAIFEKGFQSARGDSGVALNGALASVVGCLSIIDLNLLSFTSDAWTEKIRFEADELRLRYQELHSASTARQESLKAESDKRKAFFDEINTLLLGIKPESEISYSDIENVATGLQRALWKHRETVWKKDTPENPLNVLKPEVVFKKLNYQFNRYGSLGRHEAQDELYEIAGIIDKQNKVVSISTYFPTETQNFTLAHELGHHLFHQQSGLHRDRALDYAGTSIPRNRTELQADKFASYFLMPSRQVKSIFTFLFQSEKFTINEDTAFALNERTSDLRKKFRNLREFSRYLASVEFFSNRPFKSIAKQFGVSVEPMAIRLEELKLIEF